MSTGCSHRNDLVPEVAATSSPSAGPTQAPITPTARLEHYATIIREQAERYHVPSALVGAIVAVESGGNPRAQSPSGAQGLMQLKPTTAAPYGITDLFDPEANITAGTRYLHDLLERFHQNITLAVAAYKMGPAAVHPDAGVPTASRTYVDRVMTWYNAIIDEMNQLNP